MNDVTITTKNASFDYVQCEPSIAYNIRSHFSFQLPNARFTPAAAHGWDGGIKLYNLKTRCLPAGLRNELIEFCQENNYSISMDEPIKKYQDISDVIMMDWLQSIGLPDNLIPTDYQLKAITEGNKHQRCLFLSATASGKSLIAYLLYRWFAPKKLLFIVPRKSLITQFIGDITDYGCKDYSNIEIVNWQSVFRNPPEYFEQFDMIICDECHTVVAKSLSHIMESCVNAYIRFGLTGSLTGAKSHEMILKGHFGPVNVLSRASELMEKGRIAKLKIKIIVLKHSEDDRKFLVKKENRDYHMEVNFIENHAIRNYFLINLLKQQHQNSFCLFKHIEHGELLYKLLENKIDKKLFYVAGSGEMQTDTEESEKIRQAIDACSESVTLASQMFFSTGINIRNLNDVVFGSPSKSRISVMQSIGRGLRLGDDKNECVLWDIADDLSWKSRKNHTLKHLYERIKYYDEEGFDYNIYEFNLF